jgi:hypothetical protein
MPAAKIHLKGPSVLLRSGLRYGRVTVWLTEVSMETQWAVGWGTLALLNAGVAQGKNRSGSNWFLVTLLLGPVATFLLVLQTRGNVAA